MRFTPTEPDRAETAPVEGGEAGARGAPLFFFDPGWLFLIAGAAVVVATVLIPAVDDLAEARWHRDRALALEKFRSDRLQNYTDYLDALDHHEKTLVLSLAATQLNVAPADQMPLYVNPEPNAQDASVFGALEPTLNLPKPPPVPESWLQKLATNERTRVWMLAGGALCMLIGLLPASRPGESTAGRLVGLVRRREPETGDAVQETAAAEPVMPAAAPEPASMPTSHPGSPRRPRPIPTRATADSGR